MTLNRFLAFICLALIMTVAGTVQAQLPTDRYSGQSGLDHQGIPYSQKYMELQPVNNVISLVRKPELSEDQFVLRITNPFVINGCADLSNYSYEAEYKDVYLDIKINGITLDMRDQPQYAHFQCDTKTKMPMAEVVLNRQDLVKNETRQIRMHNGADTNYYNVKLSENRVMVLPDKSDAALRQRFKPQDIPGRKTALVYWFYPVGTMLLWSPGLGGTDKAALDKLRDFARTKGLVPLKEIFPEFESPLTNDRYLYYVDTSGRFADQEDGLARGMQIGTVNVEKKVFGLEKDKIVLDQKTVYAKLPGMYE